ncbi:alpha-2-antiplasmin-like [Petromyzon marinus]|uniref:alpha-2-antiplasmin-like n=1 Tax=Petromyzon marinus TaxID=7757 RepID=UPI003F6EC88C
MHWALRCLLLSAVIGCLHATKDSGRFAKEDDVRKTHGPFRGTDKAPPEAPCDVSLAPSPQEVERVVEAILELGLSLFRVLDSSLPPTTNIVISPVSIAMVLANLALGAEGETKRELLGLLALQNDCDHRILRFVFGTLAEETTTVASHVFLRRAHIEERFRSRLAAFYSAASSELHGSAREDAERMNAWALRHTGARLGDLVTSLGADTRLVLLSALYYKGEWKTKFNVDYTVKRQFVLPMGQTKMVDMVHAPSYPFRIKDLFPYQFAEFPFCKNSSLVTVSSQDSDEDFRAMQTNIRASDFRAGLSNMKDVVMAVAIPKVTLREKVDLTRALQDMAPKPLTHLFSPAADLRGLSAERLWVSDVSHSAFVRVDEEGAEAAAATAASASRSLRELALERPFLFLLRDRPAPGSAGLPLLLGRVVDPEP